MSAWEATEELWEQFGMPDRGLPKLAAELAVKPVEEMTAFEIFYLSGEYGDCPACGAEWETIDCGPHNSFNEQVHAVGCDYLAYLDWHDALLEREGDDGE